jgi:hypothetical protein
MNQTIQGRGRDVGYEVEEHWKALECPHWACIKEMQVVVRYGINTVENLFGVKTLIADLNSNFFSFNKERYEW